MKSKDTVVTPKPHSESQWCPHCREEFGIEGRIQYEREAQAEISFKLGEQEGWKKREELAIESIKTAYQNGIKEVVDWLINDQDIPVRYAHNATCYDCVDRIRIYWQAKLKEWKIV